MNQPDELAVCRRTFIREFYGMANYGGNVFQAVIVSYYHNDLRKAFWNFTDWKFCRGYCSGMIIFAILYFSKKDSMTSIYFLYTQAMAVYGQLARPSTPNDDTPNDPDNRRSTQPQTNSSEPSQNHKMVDSSRSKSEAGTESKVDAREHDVFYSQWKQVPSSSEPPHFTAATSPTRKRDFM